MENSQEDENDLTNKINENEQDEMVSQFKKKIKFSKTWKKEVRNFWKALIKNNPQVWMSLIILCIRILIHNFNEIWISIFTYGFTWNFI